MAIPVPAYVARFAPMIEGERIVITEETTPRAARYHAKRANPALVVKVWKGRLICEYPIEKTPEEARKAALISARLKAHDYKDPKKKAPVLDAQEPIEAVRETFDDGWP